MVPQIKEFCIDNVPWRIDYLGGLNHPGSSRSEPRINVYLSQLLAGSGNPLRNESLVNPGQHRKAAVNVGLISLLRMGSVWVDGVCREPNEPLQSKTLTVNANQFSLVRFDGTVELDGITQPLFTSARYRMNGLAAKEVAGSFLAVAYDPIPGMAFIAIPSTAIFQKCAATSPKAVRRLVFGEIDKIIDPSCGFMNDEPKTYFVEMFKDFRDGEAKAIANLKADPIGRREYARLRNELIASSANIDRSRRDSPSTAHMRFGFPFINDVELGRVRKVSEATS